MTVKSNTKVWIQPSSTSLLLKHQQQPTYYLFMNTTPTYVCILSTTHYFPFSDSRYLPLHHDTFHLSSFRSLPVATCFLTWVIHFPWASLHDQPWLLWEKQLLPCRSSSCCYYGLVSWLLPTTCARIPPLLPRKTEQTKVGIQQYFFSQQAGTRDNPKSSFSSTVLSVAVVEGLFCGGGNSSMSFHCCIMTGCGGVLLHHDATDGRSRFGSHHWLGLGKGMSLLTREKTLAMVIWMWGYETKLASNNNDALMPWVPSDCSWQKIKCTYSALKKTWMLDFSRPRMDWFFVLNI